jgi:hypothetical protein
MAHSHAHTHDAGAYFAEQLFTLGFSAAFGAVAIVLYANGGLNVLLAQGILRYSVLAGGIALLVLVLVRAVTLWFTVGKPAAAHAHDHDCCDHDHQHEPHNHEHEDCEHDHDDAHGHTHDHSHGGDGHSHDHGWWPIRYLALLIPLILSPFVGALSASGVDPNSVDLSRDFPKAKGTIGRLRSDELNNVTNDAKLREYYEDKIAQITGMVVPSASSDRWFTLQRLKIRCCAADAVPLNAVVIIDDSQIRDLPPEQRTLNFQALNRKWVEVTGQIAFQQHGPSGWVALLIVRPTQELPLTKLIRQIPPDPDPYL